MFPLARSLVRFEFDTGCVEDYGAHLLDAVEDEKVPERLLALAIQLQDALTEQRHRRNPN